MGKIKVGVVVGYYVPAFKAGGPIRTISAMATTHCASHSFSILTQDSDWPDGQRLAVDRECWVSRPEADVYYFDSRRLASFVRGLWGLSRRRPEFLYLNGIFSVQLSLSVVVLRRLGWFKGARLVIAPRGEFGEGALRIKPRRKELYIAAVRGLRLLRGVTWHASSAQEEREVLRLFPHAAVEVRTNETLLPLKTVADQRQLKSRVGRLRLVYVGRISEKKGLKVLFEGLRSVTHPISLDVYGSADDEGYLNDLKAMTESMPESVSVEIKGALAHENVVNTFREYDFFAFPTSHENFGHVVAESLAAACPVLAPRVTPFSAYIDHGGGVVLEHNTPAGWSALLERLSRLSDEEKFSMREAAAKTYNNWRSRQDLPSIFQQVEYSQRRSE